jgi:uncharacterized repeat protein (TIGR03803 family)
MKTKFEVVSNVVVILLAALGTAAALQAQSGDRSADRPQAGTYSLLYSFPCNPDPDGPSRLVRDSSGNLYGTTEFGGLGPGTVFKVASSGTETVLHSFAGSPSDGSIPQFGVTLDAAGNLYGTTSVGGRFGYHGCPLCRGQNGYGTVFKVTAAGTETVLYNFAGGSDGSYPSSGVAVDSAGNLYGTTGEGKGAVFKLTPEGTYIECSTNSRARRPTGTIPLVTSRWTRRVTYTAPRWAAGTALAPAGVERFSR